MFQPAFGELNIKAYQPHRPGGVVSTSLFSHEELHADLVLMLGLFQDPENVPNLMDLLRSRRAAEAVAGEHIAATPSRHAPAPAESVTSIAKTMYTPPSTRVRRGS